jgi:signal transduction histidine kinase/ActR/RegA family two-component response regulator
MIQLRGQNYYLAFHKDITERKRAEAEKQSLEERLQNAEKMEIMGKLAGRVAHDLNNFLDVLSGYSELLTERIPVGNPLREYAANILKSSERATAIVEDLLALARRGVRVMERAIFNKIIANLLATPEFDKLVAYHPNVIVKTDLAIDLLNISGSPGHLEKTILNLVSNAVEAIADSGDVKIKTENRYIDKAIEGYQTVMEGEYVVLTVSDTGKGIPAYEMKNIFEPFYTKKSMGRSGTGLGLAIVWGTVKDHNGYINVESKEGKGSTFTLYFPVTREGLTTEVSAVAISEFMGNGESILVVDDVKEQRDLAASILKTLNYQATTVSSGEEAVAYLKEHGVDLMVLDMIMDPGMDGLDTYKQVLAIRPNQKAIIVSGFSESDRVKEARSLGAGAYVRKPYIKEKLGPAVRKEVDRK